MKNIDYLKWLLKYAKKSKKDLILYCTTGLLMVVIWILLPIYMAKETLALTTNSWQSLYHIALFIFGLRFFYNILKVVISNFALKFITETYRNLHLDISKRFMNTTMKDITKKNSGYYIERLTNDTIEVSDFFIDITDDIIDILINIGSLITIFVLNKFIFMFYLYFLILLFLIKNAKTTKKVKQEKIKKEKVESLMNSNIEIIHGIEEIKGLNIKEKMLKILNKKIKEFSTSLIKLDDIERFYRFIYSSVINIFRVLLIGLCIYLMGKEKITISIALIALNYESSIFELLDYIESILHNIKKFKLSANRVLEIIDFKENQSENYGKKELDAKIVTVKLQKVSFSYNEKERILNQIDMEFKSKNSIAIVGKSGTGKTTIFNLLTKLYLPDTGKIMLNDIDINELSEKSLRSTISIVNQHPYLFHMTIKENLKLVNENLTDNEIIEACKLAQIHDDIIKMPQGYNTMIKENGSNLSGGQKQRLSIARVILRNTPIILFDEATSALDNETQRKLQLALEKMKGKYTIITIAHRLSTIMNSDEIYLLEKGKIVAQGTHKKLLHQSKIYQKLYYDTKS